MGLCCLHCPESVCVCVCVCVWESWKRLSENTLVPSQLYITAGVLDESMLGSRQLYWESLWSRTHADSLQLLKRIDCAIGKAIVLKYSQKSSNNTAESKRWPQQHAIIFMSIGSRLFLCFCSRALTFMQISFLCCWSVDIIDRSVINKKTGVSDALYVHCWPKVLGNKDVLMFLKEVSSAHQCCVYLSI